MENIWKDNVEGVVYEFAYSPDYTQKTFTARARVICNNMVMGEAYDENCVENFPLQHDFRSLLLRAMDKAVFKMRAIADVI